jgi:hypothetical protein
MAYLAFPALLIELSDYLHGLCHANFRHEPQRFARSHLIWQRFSGNAADMFAGIR